MFNHIIILKHSYNLFGWAIILYLLIIGGDIIRKINNQKININNNKLT